MNLFRLFLLTTLVFSLTFCKARKEPDITGQVTPVRAEESEPAPEEQPIRKIPPSKPTVIDPINGITEHDKLFGNYEGVSPVKVIKSRFSMILNAFDTQKKADNMAEKQTFLNQIQLYFNEIKANYKSVTQKVEFTVEEDGVVHTFEEENSSPELVGYEAKDVRYKAEVVYALAKYFAGSKDEAARILEEFKEQNPEMVNMTITFADGKVKSIATIIEKRENLEDLFNYNLR